MLASAMLSNTPRPLQARHVHASLLLSLALSGLPGVAAAQTPQTPSTQDTKPERSSAQLIDVVLGTLPDAERASAFDQVLRSLKDPETLRALAARPIPELDVPLAKICQHTSGMPSEELTSAILANGGRASRRALMNTITSLPTPPPPALWERLAQVEPVETIHAILMAYFWDTQAPGREQWIMKPAVADVASKILEQAAKHRQAFLRTLEPHDFIQSLMGNLAYNVEGLADERYRNASYPRLMRQLARHLAEFESPVALQPLQHFVAQDSRYGPFFFDSEPNRPGAVRAETLLSRQDVAPWLLPWGPWGTPQTERKAECLLSGPVNLPFWGPWNTQRTGVRNIEAALGWDRLSSSAKDTFREERVAARASLTRALITGVTRHAGVSCEVPNNLVELCREPSAAMNTSRYPLNEYLSWVENHFFIPSEGGRPLGGGHYVWQGTDDCRSLLPAVAIAFQAVATGTRDELAQAFVEAELGTVALKLLALVHGARQLNEARSIPDFQDLDKKLHTLTGALDRVQAIPRTVVAELPAATQRLTATLPASFALSGRTIDLTAGRYREEFTDTLDRTRRVVVEGEIPLSVVDALRDVPRLLDLCQVSLAEREQGIRSTGSPVWSDIDLVRIDPFVAVPLLCADAVRPDLPWTWTLDALTAATAREVSEEPDWYFERCGVLVPEKLTPAEGARDFTSWYSSSVVPRQHIEQTLSSFARDMSNLQRGEMLKRYVDKTRPVVAALPDQMNRIFIFIIIPLPERIDLVQKARDKLLGELSQTLESATTIRRSLSQFDLSVFDGKPPARIQLLKTEIAEDFSLFASLYALHPAEGPAKFTIIAGEPPSAKFLQRVLESDRSFWTRLKPDFRFEPTLLREFLERAAQRSAEVLGGPMPTPRFLALRGLFPPNLRAVRELSTSSEALSAPRFVAASLTAFDYVTGLDLRKQYHEPLAADPGYTLLFEQWGRLTSAAESEASKHADPLLKEIEPYRQGTRIRPFWGGGGTFDTR